MSGYRRRRSGGNSKLRPSTGPRAMTRKSGTRSREVAKLRARGLEDTGGNTTSQHGTPPSARRRRTTIAGTPRPRFHPVGGYPPQHRPRAEPRPVGAKRSAVPTHQRGNDYVTRACDAIEPGRSPAAWSASSTAGRATQAVAGASSSTRRSPGRSRPTSTSGCRFPPSRFRPNNAGAAPRQLPQPTLRPPGGAGRPGGSFPGCGFAGARIAVP